MKQFLKDKINNPHFDIECVEDKLIFNLKGSIPLSKSSIILKHYSTKKRIYKPFKKSKAELTIPELEGMGELGHFHLTLKTDLMGKTIFSKIPFKEQNSNKFIINKKENLKLESYSTEEGDLAFCLKDFFVEKPELIDIFEVEDDDISDLVFESSDYEYKLSAIVLVYNGGKYLESCLKSLVNQTLEGLEIILINDCSTDNSLDICKKFAQEYDNIRIINKLKNHGLATSANMGIKIAKGEYVILVDNDDIIPHDAYEKLYNKASEVDADISVGQANLLLDDRQNEMYNAERRVLENEMVINDISEFPELFNDAFYWNKIIKKSLIIDNDIKLPTGMIYADRKFSHTAYVHAKRISIIPDCVYIWRIRAPDKGDESLSQRRKETWNYINRIDSYKQDLNVISDKFPKYFKILMRRVIIPVRGISGDSEFEEAFFNYGVRFLKEECGKLDDVYDNQFDNWDNIIIYLAINDLRNEIMQMVELDLDNQRDVINDGGKSYWNLPLFRNGECDIPDDLFEIKSMIAQFLTIGKITTTESDIIFEDIRIPRHLDIDRCELQFIGKTYADGILKDNMKSYELSPAGDNVFSLKVSLSELDDFEVYDMFFKTYYPKRLSDTFRIRENCIEAIDENCSDVIVGLTAYGNLSIISQKIKSLFEIQADDEQLIISTNRVVKQNFDCYIGEDSSNLKFRFPTDKLNKFTFKWKYFMDDDSSYSVYIRLFNKNVGNNYVKLNFDNMDDFSNITLNKIDIFKNEDRNIKIISKKYFN